MRHREQSSQSSFWTECVPKRWHDQCKDCPALLQAEAQPLGKALQMALSERLVGDIVSDALRKSEMRIKTRIRVTEIG